MKRRKPKPKKVWQINWSASKPKVDKQYRCVIKHPRKTMELKSQAFDVSVGGKFVMLPSRKLFVSDSGVIYGTQTKRNGKIEFARLDNLVGVIKKTIMFENFNA